jgi:hypothetical protein
LRLKDGKKGEGRGAGAASGSVGVAKQGKGKGGRKEKEAPTGGAGVSASAGEKKRRKRRRAAAGDGEVGRLGQKGGEVLFFSFLFPFFQTLFKSNLFNSNSNKTFQTFSQSFINLLDLTQAIKNHA